MIGVFVVAVIAFVLAVTAGVMFFAGAAPTGVIFLAGSWALVWWSSRKLKQERGA